MTTKVTKDNIDTTTITSVGTLTSLDSTGNISTTGYFIGNGSQLTGLPASYANSNVTTLLASLGSNSISTTGNITVGNISVSGNITDSSGDLNITTTSGGNINLVASGSGQVILDGMKWPASDGTASYVLKTDGAGNLSWTAQSAGADPALLLSPFLLMGG